MHYVSGEVPIGAVALHGQDSLQGQGSCGLADARSQMAAPNSSSMNPSAMSRPGQGLVCYLGDEVVGGGVMVRS